jgi:hypothetical protein
VTDKKEKSRFTYLWAFVLGVVLMVGVYGLFQFTGKRTRAGSVDSTDTKSAGVVLTGAVAGDASPAPSAFLGVEVVSLSQLIAGQLGIPGEGGVLINSVIPSSPAEKAGLKRGDAIVTLHKSRVKDLDTFREVMLELEPGDNVRIVFVRDGTKDSTYAQLAAAARETTTSAEPEDSGWGVSLSPISASLRRSLAVPNDVNGVAILSVVPGSDADRAGLAPGNVIMGVDKTPISDMDDFFNALAADKDNIALLDVYAQGGLRYVPMDSSTIKVADQTQTQTTLRQKIFSIFTGAAPFSSDDDEEEGPKGGKFAQGDVQLTADNVAFNRPSTVPGDTNTGGSGSSTVTGMNRPSEVPPQLSGPTNDIVLFVGLLLLVIVYLAYREYHRPPEANKSK